MTDFDVLVLIIIAVIIAGIWALTSLQNEIQAQWLVIRANEKAAFSLKTEIAGLRDELNQLKAGRRNQGRRALDKTLGDDTCNT